MDADAWATAFMVLGAEQGKVLAAQQGLDALFIQRRDETLIEIPVGPVFEARRLEECGPERCGSNLSK